MPHKTPEEMDALVKSVWDDGYKHGVQAGYQSRMLEEIKGDSPVTVEGIEKAIAALQARDSRNVPERGIDGNA